jgi:hypothetical protein
MTNLPQGFAELTPFVAQWALATTAERAAVRGTSTSEERAAFYKAASPLAGAALDHLDNKALAAFDRSETNLMNLMLAFAHVSIAIEIQQGDEARHSPYRNLMRITRAPADER